MFLNGSMVSRRRVLALVACLSVSLLVGGCAGSKYGKQTVKPNYYRGCYEPVARLRADAEALNRNTAAGAVVGAIIGGVLGYQQRGAKGAAVGAVAGAVVGGAASYLITDSIQKKGRAERFAAYSQALDQDIRGMQQAEAAARMTAKCYADSYKALEKAFKNEHVSEAEKVARLKEIRDGTNDANHILTAYSASIAENQMVYRDIQRVEAKRGSRSLSKDQFRTISSKEKTLAKSNSNVLKELETLRQINKRSDDQLRNLVAQGGPAVPGLAGGAQLSVCPAAGAE